MMVGRIEEIDQTNAQAKAGKIAEFTGALNEDVTKGIHIIDFPTFMPEMKKVLDDMRTFVQQNGLSSDEISILKASLVAFGGNEEVVKLYPNHSSSINASDHNKHCLEITLQIEATEILLDAKER
jgi:hypothetical protein